VTLRYDKFGEIDELEFIAPKGTVFFLQRQIRQQIRSGETIYFQVSTDYYPTNTPLWIDGRFLDIREVYPDSPPIEERTSQEILEYLRSLEGVPYTWNGNYSRGIPEILEYYQPSGDISARLTGDWILEGVDSTGALHEASGGITPLDDSKMTTFGDSIHIELDTEQKTKEEIAQQLIDVLLPLDIIATGGRTWIVLDDNQVLESKHRAKFDGSVVISPLLHTIVGLLEKRVYVQDIMDELENKKAKKFVIRRWHTEPTILKQHPSSNNPDVRSTHDVLELRSGVDSQ